jgi:NnrS protein
MNDPAHRPSPVRQDDTLSGEKPPTRPTIRPDMTVRQVAADYPGCQEVLRRHGESEDRHTKFGHLEPLDHFARRQGIDLEQLLAELAQVAGVGVDRESARAQLVHRPFIASALAITLSLGAGWGTLLLFEIGWHGHFGAASAGHVVAHGAAQLWGFIGLFVVGIALRYLPMGSGGPRAGIAFSRLLLAALLAGVIGGFVWALVPGDASWLGSVSGAALVLAAVLFLGFLLRQLAGNLQAPWGRQISAAGVWMVLWAGVTLVLRTRASAEGPGAYGEPMRQLLMELAIFGFALNAIYGFGQKLLSGIVDSGTPVGGAIEATFWLHNAGVILLSLTHTGWVAFAGPLGVAALAAGAFSYALGMRGFVRVRRTTPRPEVGHRVLRHYAHLAFFWLLAGLVLLLGAALYWDARGLSPPHAYLGAVRHALTVGFMTTLILGVGQRLLPILGHTLLPWPRLVLPTFLLIAVGNLLRVLTEFATPLSATAFALMPFSAVLELSALTLFTANALRTLWPAPDPLLRTGRVTPTTSVAVLLAEHPWLEDHLFAWGLAYVGRVRSVPRELTLETLVRSERKEPEEIMARINDRLRKGPSA